MTEYSYRDELNALRVENERLSVDNDLLRSMDTLHRQQNTCENRISAAKADERARCVAIVGKWFGQDVPDNFDAPENLGYCLREIEAADDR